MYITYIHIHLPRIHLKIHGRWMPSSSASMEPPRESSWPPSRCWTTWRWRRHWDRGPPRVVPMDLPKKKTSKKEWTSGFGSWKSGFELWDDGVVKMGILPVKMVILWWFEPGILIIQNWTGSNDQPLWGSCWSITIHPTILITQISR